MSRYSIIFCGTPEFACPSLQALHNDPMFNVSLVITQPDRPVGRNKQISEPPVKSLALSLNYPVFQSNNINTEFFQIPRHVFKVPDFLVVVAFGEILSNAVLKTATTASVNLHASLLPRWRGASPIQHALLSGDKETGITIIEMRQQLDTGPILSSERIQIGERATTVSLTKKLAEIGASLLVHTLKKPLQRSPQSDVGATTCTKLTKEMGNLECAAHTAEEIERAVRALNPWPGVRTHIAEHEVKLIETTLTPSDDVLPIRCKDNTTLYVVRLQSPGRGTLSAAEWKRGMQQQ